MRKIKIYPVLAALLAVVFSSQIAWATTTVNYGTTTFFSDEKDVKPPVEEPAYDTGVRGGKNPGDDGRDHSSIDDGDGASSGSEGGLFDRIVTGVENFFNGSSVSDNSDEGSLFDWQKDFGRDSAGDSSDGTGEFIMGARGESYENMDADDIDSYNSRIADKFNFKDNASPAAPKKSKLLFTNIVIPVDMTTQYVIIIAVIVIAVGSAVGYYFWKKEMEKMSRKPKEENYD